MKKLGYIVFLLFFIFNACVIRESEIKPDFAKPAREMVELTQNNILDIARIFDKLLFLETYINTPDSLKNDFKNIYFPQYEIVNSEENNWYILNFEDSNDKPVYVIVRDSNSIHTPGAIWQIKSSEMDRFLNVNCISDKNWQITVENTFISQWNVNAELNFECADSVPPKLYQLSDFKLSGNAVLINNNSTEQNIQLTYTIKNDLIHTQSKWLFTSGGIDISAIDIDKNVSESTNVSYFVDMENDKYKFEVLYHGRLKVYDNWNYSSYLW